MNRVALIERETKETRIEVRVDLDGSGEADISCEDQFLRHMLESLAKYSSFDLRVRASGDNDHHILEDVSIVLGMAIREAMGDQPVERIASSLVPMDDALVLVALDLIDRPYVDVECPDPMYHHILRSLAMSCGMTLHVKVLRGFDEHHVVEATFKALGRALKKGVARRETTLSTKAKPKVRRK